MVNSSQKSFLDSLILKVEASKDERLFCFSDFFARSGGRVINVLVLEVLPYD